jgi:hypothetical protein
MAPLPVRAQGYVQWLLGCRFLHSQLNCSPSRLRVIRFRHQDIWSVKQMSRVVNFVRVCVVSSLPLDMVLLQLSDSSNHRSPSVAPLCGLLSGMLFRYDLLYQSGTPNPFQIQLMAFEIMGIKY